MVGGLSDSAAVAAGMTSQLHMPEWLPFPGLTPAHTICRPVSCGTLRAVGDTWDGVPLTHLAPRRVAMGPRRQRHPGTGCAPRTTPTAHVALVECGCRQCHELLQTRPSIAWPSPVPSPVLTVPILITMTHHSDVQWDSRRGIPTTGARACQWAGGFRSTALLHHHTSHTHAEKV